MQLLRRLRDFAGALVGLVGPVALEAAIGLAKARVLEQIAESEQLSPGQKVIAEQAATHAFEELRAAFPQMAGAR